jgi:hypothetical protein
VNDEKPVTDEFLRKRLAALVQTYAGEYNRGISAFAREHGFQPSFINEVLSAKKPVSERLARLVGYVRESKWVRINEKKEETP